METRRWRPQPLEDEAQDRQATSGARETGATIHDVRLRASRGRHTPSSRHEGAGQVRRRESTLRKLHGCRDSTPASARASTSE